ncbi:XRE family transcriptional regulator [Streptomyces sp. 35G-GA-8]|uniref:helix-turn-helix domain-containing protein n=1 Tax=Streptomyces sp. 35G-GA-8 TaxID=2939434 RepID=UPI00201F9AC4|nr:XRE family transcriptional regulator [Streptomyces sp. 35G-GA-8]MCL7376217.1 XRE family transcriptional regulator [Streptomyces sp. 35G-GA-8]
MPRWKALPDGLDPEVSEFTSQLRGLVDRSGLSIAALSDRTGYSKTSWERYLNGRLLAPKGAIVALAEVTGTHQGHLTTMWELAERAWSRSEMRHDMTMEAIRISQARSALGEFSQNPAGGSGRPGSGSGRPGSGSGRRGGSVGTGGPGGFGDRPAGTTVDFGAARVPGAPSVPQQRGPGGPPRPGGPSSAGPSPAGGPKRGRRKLTIFVAGVVGAALVVAAAVLLTDLGGDGGEQTVAQSPSPSPSSSAPVLPAGVKCGGDACTGKDPEEMGCGGEFVETVSSATVGTALIEVRYSKTCSAAWARITQAAVGDEVRITAGGETSGQTGEVETATNAYTPMVASPDSAGAKACATLASGETGCTPVR